MIIKQLFSHLGLSFFASFLNYVFFVFLARELGEAPFGLFSLHWARLSFFLFIATIVYYWAAIKLPNKKNITISFLILHSICLSGLGFSYFKLEWPVLYLILIAASVAQSLLAGYLIGVGNYIKHGWLNLGMALEKIILILFIASYGLAPNKVFILIYVAYLFLHLGLFWWLKGPQIESVNKSISQTVMPTVLLALMVHFFPNMDILFFSRSDGEIAMYSLVTKGVFFVQLALAQFLLSQDKTMIKISWHPLKILIVGLILALPMSYVACEFIALSFKWQTEFNYTVMYLTIVSAMSTTFFFQVYQYLLLQRWNLKLLFAPVVISILWLGGRQLSFSLTQYYATVAVFFLVIGILSLKLRSKEAQA